MTDAADDTPLQQFRRERAQEIAAGAAGDGSAGAFYRLVATLDHEAVSAWLTAEARRGTSIDDMQVALGNYVANLLMPFCVAHREHAQKVFLAMLGHAVQVFEGMLHNGDGVEVDLRTGAQREITLAGLLAERVKRPQP